jgi:hypothetical protein
MYYTRVVILPQTYVVQKFYQYAGYPKYKKYTNTYEGGCPCCREGRSWQKKRRCYYVVDDDLICCHNCGWFSKPLKWIQEVSGLSFSEIKEELSSYDILPIDIGKEESNLTQRTNSETLPLDCINLFDENQVSFYKDNKIVKEALRIVKHRRLNTAVNRPDTLWLSLTDRMQKNRIVIPFYDEQNQIPFYQTRAIISNDKNIPKYLGKLNGEKSLFNLNKISLDLEYIFIFEGPIDAFFVKNSTAVAGIQEKSSNMFSALQKEQLSKFKFHKRIWVLDSQWLDSASRNKTTKLIDNGETVFVWPEKIGKKFKDFNDLCIAANIDEISPRFIIENSSNGLKAKLLMSGISR